MISSVIENKASTKCTFFGIGSLNLNPTAYQGLDQRTDGQVILGYCGSVFMGLPFKPSSRSIKP